MNLPNQMMHYKSDHPSVKTARTKVRPKIRLSSIADRFTCFIIDQWGVLHDGARIFAEARHCLEALYRQGKRVILLSNSGKRAHTSHLRLAELGLDRSLYSDVVTSGEHVHHCLKTRPDAFYQGLGKRFFIFPWDGDRQIIDGLGFIEVNRMEDADFVLCAGVERGGLAAYLDDLDRARSCNLPMIVANPDLVSKKPDGTLQLCPGSIANHYETMGGQVRWHGKPDPAIYQFCASGIQPDKTLAIGDSLTHDIRGGQNAGYRTLFIEDGIHHLELAEHGLAQLCQRHSVQPDYCSSILKW